MTWKEVNKDNVQSQSLLNQNFLVARDFQSTALLCSSFTSLGVGLGVRESRVSSPTLVSNDAVEATSWTGGYELGTILSEETG